MAVEPQRYPAGLGRQFAELLQHAAGQRILQSRKAARAQGCFRRLAMALAPHHLPGPQQLTAGVSETGDLQRLFGCCAAALAFHRGISGSGGRGLGLLSLDHRTIRFARCVWSPQGGRTLA